jgi:CBS domain-containing protein
VLPVVDAGGRLRGMVSLQDLSRVALEAGTLGPLVIAADLAADTERVAPSDSLLAALRKMGARGAEALPVVGEDEQFLGLLTRAHVLAVYEKSVAEPEPGESTAPGRG